MGLRKIQWIVTQVIFWLCVSLNIVSAQENAIGGSVRTKKDVPLPDVKISVAQKPVIADKTREKDGIYLLSVPKSLSKIDIIYEHQNYLKSTDEDVKNDQAQNKRPIVFLRPNDPTSIGEFSNAEIDQIVAESKKIVVRGTVENLPPLIQVGQDNLNSLLVAASEFRDVGRRELQLSKYTESEANFLKAIAIQERVEPDTTNLAQTLDDYAILLRKTGRNSEANQRVARAERIRSYEIRKRDQLVAGAYSDYSADYYRQLRMAVDEISMGARKYEQAQVLRNADRLPDIGSKVTPVLTTGLQYGKVSIPAGSSKSFSVLVNDESLLLITIISDMGNYDLVVLDSKGKEVARSSSPRNTVFWRSKDLGTYTVIVSNKGSKLDDIVVRISSIDSEANPKAMKK